MASYTRRSTFGDGDLITAALFNNEYNQLVDAFSNTTGHKHDGTVGEGPVIGIIGDAGVVTPFNKILVDSTNDHIEFWIDVSGTSTQQFYIADGAIVPVTDNDVDLGTSSLQFKDLYINGTANIDSLVADTADINGGTIDGVTIGASSAGAITGTTITATSFVIGSANITETELEILDGATLTTTELNYVDGVTSSIQTQINTKAPLASPSLTGIPTAPTAASNTNTTQIATTAYVQTEITDLIDAAPGTLDTLNELAAAINDDANYNSTLTTALATKLPLAGGTMTGNVTYSDNVKAQFGTSQDLQIYHDGSNSFIKDAGTGNLNIIANELAIYEGNGTDLMIGATPNGAVTLSHNAQTKLATTSTGIDVTGVITTDGLTTSADINFGDNDKAVFGAGGDLEIYHDGSHSYVRNTVTGNLYIRNLSDDKDIILQSDDGAGGLANYVQVDGSNGEVRLSHYGSEKFNTTSTGIDVTGTVVSDGLTVEGDAKINDTDATPLVIQRNGGTDANTSIHYEQNTYNTYVGTGNSGTFVVGNSADLGSSRRFAIEQNNDISFYEDTGSTAKLFWDASAESLGIGTTSPSRTLHIKDSVAGIRLEDSDGTSYGEIIYNEGSNGLLIRSDENNADSGSNIIFEVDGGEKARIDSSGNVLVGKTSASSASIGFQAGQNGFTAITRASAQPLVLNRTTNDGIIVEFKKDSTQVGSIGAYNSATAILSGSAGSYSGLYLNTNKIEPVGNNFGSEIRANNTIDIGSSTYKFKDIYLSGTANFGSLSDGTITITGFVDEDNMATNSATLVPTQQSVKAYVDSQVSSAGGNGISFEDNEKAQFGDGNDLQIYHDGSNSYISDEGTGELRLRGSSYVKIMDTNNEVGLQFRTNGAVTLYHNNLPKFETTSTGIDVTGIATMDGLTVGTTSDAYSQVLINSSTTGESELRMGDTDTDAGSIAYTNSNDTMTFRAAAGARMSLNSTGIDVTGTVTSDGLTVSDSQAGGVTAQIQNSNPTQTGGTRLDFLYSGSTVTGRIQNRFNGGDFQTDWYTGNDGLEIFTDLAKTEKRLDIASNGDISFYDDTGSNQGLFWDASAEQLLLGITATAAGGSLVAKTDSNGYGIAIEENSGSERWSLGVDVDGDLNFLNSTDTTPTVTFNDAGNVGIGDTTPDAKLTVQGDVLARDEFRGEVVSYAANQDAPYLIAGTSGYTGATTNWNTYGFQHRIKSNANGLSRITIDTSIGEAFTVTNNNRVGIGTDSPAQALEIAGSVRIDNGASFTAYEVYRDNILYGKVGGGSNQFTIQASNNKDINIFDDSGNGLTVKDGGNVGIGTTNPDSPLRVSATASSSIPALGAASSHAAIGAGGFGTMFGTRNTGIGYIQQQRFDGTATAYSLALQPNGGNIGIGTASPSSTLHVVGTITADTHFTSSDTNTTLSTSGSGGTVRLRPNGLSSTTGQVTVLSSGNVGIGTDSPSDKLHISTGSDSDQGNIAFTIGGSNASNARTATINKNTSTPYELTIQAGNHASSNITTVFKASDATETMRIDSSGNVIVGHTAADDTTASASLRSDGRIYSTVAADQCLSLNRLSSDGEIITFKKDSTTVGNIGTVSSGDLYIADNRNAGIKLDGGNNQVIPVNSAGAQLDNTLDLGKSDTRFKDLHLSGNANLGSSNYLRFTASSSGSDASVLFGNSAGTGGSLSFKRNSDSTTLATVKADGKVGIGTDSPAHKLYIDSGTTNVAAGLKSSDVGSYIGFEDDTTGNTGSNSNVLAGANGNNFVIFTGAAERARIDSSGNLLVSTTNASVDTGVSSGVVLSASDQLLVGTSASHSAAFNRIGGADGDIIQLKKNGSSVGSIGVINTNNLTIGGSVSNHSGLQFGTAVITPMRANSESDAQIDIGFSNARFKDLYLSNNIKAHGASSPTLDLKDTTNNCNLLAYAQNSTANIGTYSNHPLIFDTNSTERMRIDSAGNVGIGTSSPSRKLTISESSQYAMNTLNPTSTAGNKSGIAFHGLNSQSLTQFYAGISANFDNTAGGSQSGSLIFETINGNSIAERMRINSSGNLLVGTTDSSVWNNGAGGNTGTVIESDGSIQLAKSNNVTAYLNRLNSDGDIVSFRKDGSTVGSIGTYAGDIVIGTGDTGVRYDDNANALIPWNITNNTSTNGTIGLGYSTVKFTDLHLSGKAYVGSMNVDAGNADGIKISSTAPYLFFNDTDTAHSYDGSISQSGTTLYVGGATPAQGIVFRNKASFGESARLDTSGNFLVGTTNTFPPSDTGNEGVAVKPDNIAISRNASTPLFLDRMTSDGVLIDLRKDNSTGGVIGIQEQQDNAPELYIANGTGTNTTGLAFWDYIAPTRRISPCNGAGTYVDNAIDLGYSGARFDDIYATNGTIQTSDRNDKQDIQALTDAETRVATACKGLLRRFRWQDAVTEKGDEARYHFGIISQDLQSAFTAEGLDAGDYGMFISQTWEDSEGVEQTRLGVRYSELLAFIIAAI